MKKILIIISFIVFFIIGNLLPFKLSQINYNNLISIIESNPDSKYLSIAKVKFCNNSDTKIDSINFNSSAYIEDLDIGECSEYVSTDAFYKNFNGNIRTKVDGKRYNYTGNIFCPVGEKLYRSGKHIFYINDLFETEDEVVEYFAGIDYKLKSE